MDAQEISQQPKLAVMGGGTENDVNVVNKWWDLGNSGHEGGTE
jgi:hypothetical protein